MSEEKKDSHAEAQKTRWVKYGANVGLSIILVVALAAIVVWIAQEKHKRVDMTAGGLYSLKPQTINIIRDLKGPVKIVSMYRKVDAAGKPIEEAQIVADLLEEYASKGKNIQIDQIDPVREKDKEESLYAELVTRYGSEMKNYQAFLDEFLKKDFEQVKKQFEIEADAAAPLAAQMQKPGNDEQSQDAATIVDWVQQKPEELANWKKTIERLSKDKHPEYKTIVDSIKDRFGEISRNADLISQFAVKNGTNMRMPEALRNYLAQAGPRLAAIKKQADAVVERIGKLGELKVDEVKQALRVEDPILVMGEKDYRVIPAAQLWPVDEQAMRAYMADGKIKPRFAGEQQVTTAILTLTSEKKQKVVFVRPGGQALTNPGFPPFIPGGPFSRVADRLREYNFEVLEKDMSGMSAMQSQMRGMPPEKDASDEEMKDAVWVVLNLPSQQRQMAPNPIGPKLAEHLKNGGSALVLSLPQADSLAEALADWGVDLKTDTMAVHEAVQTSGARSGDMVEEAQRIQFIFVLKDYGNHLLTSPLKSLESILFPIVPVTVTPKTGYTATPLLPVPQSVKVWGTKQLDDAMDGKQVSFDEKTDMPAPLFGGGAVEKEKGGRLVVIGSLQFIQNDIVRLPDPELLKERIRVARFPGNAELFANSIFWLAKTDTLIAISPTAMEVSRIDQMSDKALAFWHYGVLMGILPALVLVAGLMVYLKRRD